MQGEQIIVEKIGNNLIKFYYDGTGVCGFNYNGTDYYYQKNIQGDILKVFNGNGTLYAEYSYDAWGKCAIKTNVSGIAAINPFRYRGYYLDDETGLYYLNARYYDPEIGRFISADSIAYLAPESINGINLYAYCLNNPVMYTDENGTMPNWLKWLIGGISFVGAIALTFLSGGALAPVFIAMGLSIAITGLAFGVSSVLNGGGFLEGFADGAADGALWGGIFALGGALLRTAKILTQGVTIGENMTRVTKYANSAGQAVYKGMPGYKVIKFFKGGEIANKMAMAHNEAFIKRMMRWGVKITDIGMEIAKFPRSQFYLMEMFNTRGYFNLVKLMMLH